MLPLREVKGTGENNTVDGSDSQADVFRGARNAVACAPQRWGILAGWKRGVGLRADPADKRTGYLPLSAGDDVPVAQLSCRLRPVAQPSWPAGQHILRPPKVMPAHDGCPRVLPLGEASAILLR